MYQEYYGLRKDPFSLNPDLDFLYESSVHEEAIAHLVYGLEQKEDIIFIAGDIGTGKTLAIHRLLDQVSASVVTVSINVTTIGFEDLVRLVLLKLGVAPAGSEPIAILLHRLEQELVRLREGGRSVLLVIDEAQNLSLDSLESVRLLLNLAQPGGSVLQIVLTGQLGLKAKLEDPKLRQLRQRIKVSYTFGTLSRQEVDEYVRHRLLKAGREEPLFKEETLDRIFAMSRGIPRVVNYLASKALLSGFVAQAKLIEVRHVEESETEIDELLGTLFSEAPASVAESTPAAPALQPPTEAVEQAPREPAPAPAPAPADAIRRERKGGGRRRGGWVLVIVVLLLLLVVAGYFTSPYWMPALREVRTDAQQTRPAGTETPRTPTEAPEEAAQPATVADGEPDRNEGGEEPSALAVVSQPDAAPAATTVPAAVDSFVAHVASFQDASRAQNFRNRLAGQGLPAYVDLSPDSAPRRWHRVYIGPFAGHDETARVVAELKSAGTIKYSQIAPH